MTEIQTPDSPDARQLLCHYGKDNINWCAFLKMLYTFYTKFQKFMKIDIDGTVHNVFGFLSVDCGN